MPTIRELFLGPGTAVLIAGLLHLLHDDGTGHFTDQAVAAGTKPSERGMGLAFGDFNSDGSIDFMATNFGDYGLTLCRSRTNWATSRPGGFSGIRTAPLQIPAWAIFVLRPLAGEQWLWITKNNGTTDLAFFGHIDVGLVIVTDNPGVLLRNDGAAHFQFDPNGFVSTNYNRREVFGVAAGDLNNDGFDDVVTASAMDIPDSVPLTRYPVSLPPNAYGSPFGRDSLLRRAV